MASAISEALLHRQSCRSFISKKDNAMDQKTREKLEKVSTATICTALFKRGLRNQFIQEVRPLNPSTRTMVGEAFTLRYMPAREDLNPITAFQNREHPQRKAVEECPPGCVFVIDSRKDPRAASAGSILVSRLMMRRTRSPSRGDDGVRGIVAEQVRILGLYPAKNRHDRFRAWREKKLIGTTTRSNSPARKSSAGCWRARRARRWPRASARRCAPGRSSCSSPARPAAGRREDPSVRPGVEVEITREPVGVVGMITPWNFPIAIPAWKIAPGAGLRQHRRLQAGRPGARVAPGRCDILRSSRAGLPAGVFNLVMGRGSVVGQAILEHRRTSTPSASPARSSTGRRVAQACAPPRR
jgi:hypothetical protein